MSDSGQLARIAVELGQVRRAALDAELDDVARYLADAIADIRRARRHLDGKRPGGDDSHLVLPEYDGMDGDGNGGAPPANPRKARRAARRERTVGAGPSLD